MSKGPISQFIEKYYLHFNSAALVDAAKGYENSFRMVPR
jgi:deoxyhypusine synthase